MINVDCSAYSTKIFGGISEKLLSLLKLLTLLSSFTLLFTQLWSKKGFMRFGAKEGGDWTLEGWMGDTPKTVQLWFLTVSMQST